MDVRQVLFADAVSIIDDRGRHRKVDIRVNAYEDRELHLEQNRLAALLIRRFIKFRRRKDDMFPGVDFSDPAWDMILDLTAARLENRELSVTSVCLAASVPMTTALRHLNRLRELGIVVRERDERDSRRSMIRISREAFDIVMQYLLSAYRPVG